MSERQPRAQVSYRCSALFAFVWMRSRPTTELITVYMICERFPWLYMYSGLNPDISIRGTRRLAVRNAYRFLPTYLP